MIWPEALFTLLSSDNFVDVIKDYRGLLAASQDEFIIILTFVFFLAKPVLNGHIALISL